MLEANVIKTNLYVSLHFGGARRADAETAFYFDGERVTIRRFSTRAQLAMASYSVVRA